jgi:very-short-patch-repair endonuclease
VGTWIDYATAREVILSGEWGPFLGRLEHESVLPQDVVPAFERAYHVSWLEDVFRRDKRLGRFRGRDHEGLVEQFRRLDRELIEHAREVIIHRCNEQRPSIGALPGSETAVVSKEASKRRRHKPVRLLFKEIPRLLPVLKPCLLMSPLSVSQFLDPQARFDLVIFDEASQVTVEDAICALYRGNRHAIAGDSKQLPPTGFFRVTEDEDHVDSEWESESNWESVLDRAQGSGLRAVPLRWHYRSRHESLIAYSNRAFYGSRLVTFPSTWGEHAGLGVQFHHVPDGVYDRGGSRTNRREAEVVRQLVFDHMRDFPGKSLGVVTFNDAQRMAVQDAVDRHRYDHREFEDHFREDRLDGFFVKNLENVQGDERDCMIFSITYGRDVAGKFTMNFGPVSGPGGERRLNVAITRAREKVVIVSSVRASDFPVAAELTGGGLHVRSYLDYAERGEKALLAGAELSEGDFESTFEVAVAEAIRELGYQVVPQVGVSGFRVDLGVVHPDEPGRFALGVECDGAAYHSAATARDRDRLRQDVLENLGWRIVRVWSPDWNANRGLAIDRLRVAIEEAVAAPAPSLGSAAPEPVDQRETFELTSEMDALFDEPNLHAAARDIGTVPQSVIAAAVVQVVRQSFSIERTALVQQAARSLGYRRTGARIQDAIGLAIAALLNGGAILDNGGTITLPRTEIAIAEIDEVPDWDAVIEDQPDLGAVPDIEESNNERVAPPDGNGLLVLRSDMPLLELEVQLIKVIGTNESAHGSPVEGNRLVAGQFTIRNRGRVLYEPYRAGARWAAEDDQGNVLEPTGLHVDPSLHATRIRPGGVGTGFITFEVPTVASLHAIMFTPSENSDTGIWPDVWRNIEAVPTPPAKVAPRSADVSSSGDKRVDVMNVSSSGATVSIAIDALTVTEATELLDGAGIKLKAGTRYVSERRGPRQTVFLETASFNKALKVLKAAGFDVRLGPLGH